MVSLPPRFLRLGMLLQARRCLIGAGNLRMYGDAMHFRSGDFPRGRR